MRKFYKTTITVEVLSDEDSQEIESLEDVHSAITEGGCSGQFSVTKIEELNAEQAAEALIAQGSDPEFFMDLPQIIEELERVRSIPKEELPLILNSLETDDAKELLEKRMKE